ncbi:MAG: TIM-barrel domain-containing protein [Hymenobacter sp.]
MDSTQTALGSFKSVRNAFPLEHIKGVYTHQRATTSDKRVFILTRSAFAGQQRYAAATWSGDIQGSWAVLRKQISGGLNFCLAGIPYWTTDIGAFSRAKPTPWAWPTPHFGSCTCAGSSSGPSRRCSARTAPTRPARYTSLATRANGPTTRRPAT